MFVAADLLPLDDRPREDSYILTTTLSPSQMIFFNVINNKKKKWTEKNEYLQTEKKTWEITDLPPSNSLHMT